MKIIQRIPLLLLCAFPLVTTIGAVQPPIAINYGLIKMKAKELPLEGIKITFRKLKELQNSSQKNEYNTVIYKNEEHTLSQMVAFEQSLATRKLTSQERAQEIAQLKESLNKALANINPLLDPFKESIRKYKTFIKAAIGRWADQRKRKEKLTAWFDLPEAMFIEQNLSSFQQVSTFVDELAQFLIDILYTVTPNNAQNLLKEENKARTTKQDTYRNEL